MVGSSAHQARLRMKNRAIVATTSRKIITRIVLRNACPASLVLFTVYVAFTISRQVVVCVAVVRLTRVVSVVVIRGT